MSSNTVEEWPDECPECRELLEGNHDDTGLICPECNYEYKFKGKELEAEKDV